MPRAASLATKMLDQYKSKLEEVALVPSSGGAFEIKVGDELIFSKLATDRFPSEGSVLQDLDSRL